MSRIMIISADGHVGRPVDSYSEYMESKYRADYEDYLRTREALQLAEITTPEALALHHERWYESNKHASMWDPELRLKVLEEEGAVAEVLFPDRVRDDEIPFSEGALPGCSYELQAAGDRAYNRWLADFCRPYPGRFGGLASLRGFWEVDPILEELDWVSKQRGIRGVLLPGVGPDRGDWLAEEREPIWSACEEAGLVVNFHVGVGAPPRGGGYYPPTPAGAMIANFEGWFWAQRALWWMIYGGVLERHPDLRVAFTETGSAWAGDRIAMMDWFRETPYKPKAVNVVVPRRATEYFRRQCAIGSSILSVGDLENRHEIGVENMMFGLDLPHLEGTLGLTVPYLQRTFGAAAVSESEARAILGGNALSFYGFDAADLLPIANEVGPQVDDILGLPADSDDGDPAYHWVRRPAR